MQLAAAGCEAVAINLHHLGEQIRQRFGDSFAGMPLTWSDEPRILGTLGAFQPLRGFFAEADVAIVVNGDSLCRWPLKRMLRRHAGSGAAATLLLASRPDPEAFGGGVGIDKAGTILSFRREAPARADVVRRFVFAGAHVLDPALVADVGPGPSDIVTDLYMPILGAGGRIRSVVTGRRWHDMGTPQRFLEGVLDWARAGLPERLWRRSWISPEAAVAPGAVVRRSAVEGGVKIGARRARRALGAAAGRPGRRRERAARGDRRLRRAPAAWELDRAADGHPRGRTAWRSGPTIRPWAARLHAVRAEARMRGAAGRPFELLVFDWDGTLMDSLGPIVACTQAVIAELGLPELPEQAIRGTIGLGLRETVDVLSPGCDEALYGRILESYRGHWHGTYRDLPVLFPGVPELLRRLADEGYLLAVATGKSRRGLEYALATTGLGSVFHSTRTCDEALSKPHPQMLLDILDDLGVRARDALDDRRHDLRPRDGAERRHRGPRRVQRLARP